MNNLPPSRVCGCDICLFAGEVDRAKLGTRDDMLAMIDTLYSRYINEGMDRCYAEAIIDGSWPSADEVIAYARQKRAAPSAENASSPRD